MPPDEAPWEEVRPTGDLEGEFPVTGRLGGESILIIKTASGLRGIERYCPHQKAPLTKAVMMGGTMLRCPMHNFVFRLSDGLSVNCPAYRLRVFEIRTEEGRLVARPVADC